MALPTVGSQSATTHNTRNAGFLQVFIAMATRQRRQISLPTFVWKRCENSCDNCYENRCDNCCENWCENKCEKYVKHGTQNVREWCSCDKRNVKTRVLFLFRAQIHRSFEQFCLAASPHMRNMARDGPKMMQDGPQEPLSAPKTQKSAKTGPRWAQDGSRMAQDNDRMPFIVWQLQQHIGNY